MEHAIENITHRSSYNSEQTNEFAISIYLLMVTVYHKHAWRFTLTAPSTVLSDYEFSSSAAGACLALLQLSDEYPCRAVATPTPWRPCQWWKRCAIWNRHKLTLERTQQAQHVEAATRRLYYIALTNTAWTQCNYSRDGESSDKAKKAPTSLLTE